MMRIEMSEWKGTVWQVKGIDGSHLCEVCVKADPSEAHPNIRWAYFNCTIDELPGYGERVQVTFSREVEG